MKRYVIYGSLGDRTYGCESTEHARRDTLGGCVAQGQWLHPMAMSFHRTDVCTYGGCISRAGNQSRVYGNININIDIDIHIDSIDTMGGTRTGEGGYCDTCT